MSNPHRPRVLVTLRPMPPVVAVAIFRHVAATEEKPAHWERVDLHTPKAKASRLRSSHHALVRPVQKFMARMRNTPAAPANLRELQAASIAAMTWARSRDYRVWLTKTPTETVEQAFERDADYPHAEAFVSDLESLFGGAAALFPRAEGS